jgi:hypothetical protein
VAVCALGGDEVKFDDKIKHAQGSPARVVKKRVQDLQLRRNPHKVMMPNPIIAKVEGSGTGAKSKPRKASLAPAVSSNEPVALEPVSVTVNKLAPFAEVA